MKKSGLLKFFDNYKLAIAVLAICAILGLIFYNLANGMLSILHQKKVKI